jgi:hypothetical protein
VNRRVLIVALAGVASGSLIGAGSAAASGSFKTCKSLPNRLDWNIEAKGVKCAAARGLASHGAQGGVKKVRKHVFRYKASGFTCLYTVFHSTKAQDSEGEIFDCRDGHGGVVRWSDSPEIEPHSLQ